MLELYYAEGCPYCKKVIDFLESNNIKYVRKNIAEEANYDKVINTGHKAQVPFLIDTDNDKSMYESDEIINYIQSIQKQ